MHDTTNHETAVLGGGCFWCLEAVFADLEGVVQVESGYCGGKTVAPDYRQVCEGGTGHAEVVRLLFDPARLDFATLLAVFFAIHDPTTLNRQGNDIGSQYRSVIFAQNDEQLRIARETIEALGTARAFPRAIVTELRTAAPFWPAEGMHQDYFRKNPDQPYCQYVVAPKIARFRERFATRRKRST